MVSLPFFGLLANVSPSLFAATMAWLIVGFVLGFFIRFFQNSQSRAKESTGKPGIVLTPLRSSDQATVKKSLLHQKSTNKTDESGTTTESREGIEVRKAQQGQLQQNISNSRTDKPPSDANSSSGSSSEYTTESSDSEECSSEDEEDAERSDRIKMVLVALCPKGKAPNANDLAQLAAQSAVEVLIHVQKSGEANGEQQNAATTGSAGPSVAVCWDRWVRRWRREGVTKITLKAPDLETFATVKQKLSREALPYVITSLPTTSGHVVGSTKTGGGLSNSGAPLLQQPHTDVLPTIACIGPAPSKRIDRITGELKLFS